MSRDLSTVVQNPLEEILRRRGRVPHKKRPSRRVVDFLRSVEAKVSGRLLESTSVNSTERVQDSQHNVGIPSIGLIPPSEREGEIDYRTPDTANESYRNPLRIPGCSPATFAYPRTNANRNTKEDPQLAEFQQYIDYSLRLCGTSPQDCVPSILVFCRPAEFKNLRALLTSPQLKYQYARRRQEPKYPWKETPMLATEQDHKPFFNLYFWRAKRPRELYWGRAPVCLRHDITEDYRLSQHPLSSNYSTTMLGSVVQLSGADQRSSTLGCMIKVDSEYYAITTMHTFAPSESSRRAPSITESDDISTSNNSTAPTVFAEIEVPLPSYKEIFEPDVYELLLEDDYYVSDVQYESLSESEECDSDQADDWPLDTQGSTLHQPWDAHCPEETNERLALFPSSQQLQDSGQLDLDWALIKVTNLDHSGFNTFYPSGIHSEPVSLDKVARSQPQFETPVLIVTSGKVPQRGFLQPGMTFLGGISGKTPSSVWTVILEDGSSLKKGDSGSVVVDATSYDIYGHVVGCNPMGEIYISPYGAILQQIRRLFPDATVGLPESSSTRLCLSGVAPRTYQCVSNPDMASPPTHDNNTSIVRPEIEHGSILFNWHSDAKRMTTGHSIISDIPSGTCSVLPTDHSQLCMRSQSVKNRGRGTSSESVATTPNLSSHDASILAARFREYLRDNLVDGVNGEGKAAPYIPFSALKRYFTKGRIDTIMKSIEIYPADMTKDIQSSYLRIFSLLVYLGYPDSITWFTSNGLQDSDLPLTGSPPPQNPSWYTAFLKEQWTFCPIIISADGDFTQTLPSKAILPVTYEKAIDGKNKGPDDPKLWQVKVHPGCSHKLVDDTVVFKVYQGTRGQHLYTTETNFYSQLRFRFHANSAIRRAFASFSFPESERCIAVVEYANGGSLIDFFHTESPPSSNENVLLLWESVLRLTEALYVLRGVGQRDKLSEHSPDRTHRDIKPENILVFSKDDNDSTFDTVFKFDSFALVEPSEVPPPDEEMIRKESRSQMYLPPEASNSSPIIRPTMTDIWSLGAIFSDLLVWSMCGEAGRQRYRDRRMIELVNHNACYHDGEKRLRAVEKHHELALLRKKEDDVITPFMSRTILSKMLVPARERFNEIEILESFQAEVKSLRLSLPGIPTIPQSNSPDLVGMDTPLARILPEASRSNPISPMLTDSPRIDLPAQSPVFGEQRNSSLADNESSEAEAPVEILYRVLKDKKRLSKLENFHKTKRNRMSDAMDSMMLPGIREARQNLKGRDQIFLIDDFSYMEQHRRQIMKTARVISYVCKQTAAEEGMQLFVASKATKKPRKFKTSSQIEQAIKHTSVVNGACDMGACLDYVLKRVCDDGKPNPKSIYIFTDGLWERNSGGSGADEVIRTISGKRRDLKASERELSGLSIQFIQFGHDPEGTKNLERVEHAHSELATVRHFKDSLSYVMRAGIHAPKALSVEDRAESIDAVGALFRAPTALIRHVP
ncbi:uncharacterized protein FFB20_13313 [Fusarium fujikuroi]|nr:uncharacterized protein FFB20_13313 [Fusarium fujikuroi]